MSDSLSSQPHDDWYVRFPDGKVMHAANTKTVRKNIDRGRIPLQSTVRRSPEEEWVLLAWMSEFADLVKLRTEAPAKTAKPAQRRRKHKPAPNSVGEAISTSTRMEAQQMRTVGVRNFLPELLAALENTVMRRKLTIIFSTGLLVGALFALSQYPLTDFGIARGSFNLTLGVLGLLLTAGASTQLTRATYIELSRMRPARPAEIRPGWGGRTIRLFIAQLFVVGFAVGLILLLRAIPPWLLVGDEQAWSLVWQLAAHAAVVLTIVGEVVLWPLVVLALLLAPIIVIEEASVETGLTQWLKLLGQYLGSVLLYEVLAVGIGLALAFVAALPLLFFWHFGLPSDRQLAVTAMTVRNVLLGLPAALLFAYLTVANVFIYLNLRYEATAGRKKK